MEDKSKSWEEYIEKLSPKVHIYSPNDKKAKDIAMVILDKFWTLQKPAIKSFIQTQIQEAEKRVMRKMLEEIRKMKLWSKGNVEGTRQDILARLKDKFKL